MMVAQLCVLKPLLNSGSTLPETSCDSRDIIALHLIELHPVSESILLGVFK